MSAAKQAARIADRVLSRCAPLSEAEADLLSNGLEHAASELNRIAAEVRRLRTTAACSGAAGVVAASAVMIALLLISPSTAAEHSARAELEDLLRQVKP